jgi:hypothetical protein
MDIILRETLRIRQNAEVKMQVFRATKGLGTFMAVHSIHKNNHFVEHKQAKWIT